MPCDCMTRTKNRFICCCINAGQSAKKSKKISLSLRLSLLQAQAVASSVRVGSAVPARVTSVEDHGYLLDLGIKASHVSVWIDLCEV